MTQDALLSEPGTWDELLGLRGKKALVLGGGQGMGEGIAQLLARAGAHVALVDREVERAAAVAARLRQSAGRLVALRADVCNDAELVEVISEADKQLQGLDILVAIVGMATFKPSLELSMAEWDLDQQRCLRYVFLASQSVARLISARQGSGAIVCISSMSGVRSAVGHAAYGSAKSALLNLVRTLAVEWAPYRIRVNAVTPGSISTPNFPDSPQVRDIMSNSLVPMRRNGTIDEVCRPILFLCSEMSAYVTGHNLLVDGGWNAANLFR